MCFLPIISGESLKSFEKKRDTSKVIIVWLPGSTSWVDGKLGWCGE